MVGRPRAATFVVIETTAGARRNAAGALRRLGFARLLPERVLGLRFIRGSHFFSAIVDGPSSVTQAAAVRCRRVLRSRACRRADSLDRQQGGWGMKLVPVALYVGDIPGAPSDSRIRRRYRKKALSTQVECTIETVDEKYVAVPWFRPQVPKRGRYRMQLRVPLLSGVPDNHFALVIQPVHETLAVDPEQTILAPIYSGPDRLIFEFNRAEVVWCALDGTAGVRFAAINPLTGEVGTRERSASQPKYETVLKRCQGQLNGDALLFPPRCDLRRPASRIPAGQPMLHFP